MTDFPRSDPPLIRLRHVTVSFDDTVVVGDVSMEFNRGEITALIGPAGAGKSSTLLAMNRLLELRTGSLVDGTVELDGQDVYAPEIRAEEIRRRLSYIDSRPACFPRSIRDNVAWGARINGFSGDEDQLVEDSLRRAGLWDEVKGMLKKSALRLSGGQRQRLCIARALAVTPDCLLLDEPTITLDPIATGRIEDVLIALKEQICIVFATHDHLQAGRIAEKTALILPGSGGYGELIEQGRTEALLLNPKHQRTEDYITGKHVRNSRYTV